ncbi:MAG TPA: hypothetical protein VGG91_11590 [Myxococcaceae bacterium]
MERADSTRRWERFEPWAAALALVWCGVRLGRGLGPTAFYNSDCAVPILLMQGMGEGAFTLFYPRQDRFGTWPFLLGRALNLQTPEAFHVMSVLGLCSAAIPLSAILGSPALAVLVLIVPFLVSHTVAWTFLQAGQPYLFQVVALCWAWWACRGALTAPTRGRRVLALGGFTVLSSLAAWMNTASLGMALVLAAVEVARARTRPRAALPLLGALGAAVGLEAALHRWHNAFCVRTFGAAFITPLRLDRGHLLANVGGALGAFAGSGGLWPWLVGAATLGLRRRSREERLDQLTLLLLAASVLPGLALIRYFRENDFAARYLALPVFWAVAAAVLGLLGTVLAWGRVQRQWVLGVALVLLAIAVPAGPPDPLAMPRAEAARLAAEGPAVIIGGYLDVYVPASLAPRGLLVPIPQDGDLNRFPATHPELRPGRVVLAPCALAGPDGTLVQHRALLRRVDGAPVEASGGSWCRHVVAR